MSLPSFLVVGGGSAGCAVAAAVAARGADVAVIESTAARLQTDGAAVLQSLGVEVRVGLSLVGVVDVGTHLEAELSNGHVENFDGILLADPAAVAVVEVDARGITVIGDDADAEREAARLVRPHRVG